jgi:hypothetical protein
MALEHASPFDPSSFATELERRAEQERAAGDTRTTCPASSSRRGRGRSSRALTSSPETRASGFAPSSGSRASRRGTRHHPVKRLYLRLLFYVFDDLARQTDKAIRHVEAALAVEVATRERLERELEQKIRELEGESGCSKTEPKPTLAKSPATSLVRSLHAVPT